MKILVTNDDGIYGEGLRYLVNFAKELGDIAWYLAEAATAIDMPLEDILQANIDKLKKRYPDGFETKKSLVRLKGDI